MAIEIKDGRYGSYVTDGKINATLPKTTQPNDVTLDVAIQLIAEKKAKGPTKKRQFKKRKQYYNTRYCCPHLYYINFYSYQLINLKGFK